MRILLLGATGQVGWELARSLPLLGEVFAPDRVDGDLSNPASLISVISKIQPELIVNAAAYTQVDQAESEEALATAINGQALAVLAAQAKKLGALLIHYSTDYVFDGMSAKPYVETDTTCPLNAYGRSKLLGEQEIMNSGCDYLIFRTSWVYAARGHNFLRTVLRLAQERKSLRVVNDQLGAPTWVRTIAEATLLASHKALGERQQAGFESGIFHLTAAGSTSWHGFAEAILSTVRDANKDLLLSLDDLQAIPSSAYPQAAQRPLNSCLNTTKISACFGLTLPNWQTALSLCLKESLCIEELMAKRE